MARKRMDPQFKTNAINLVTNAPLMVNTREWLGQRIKYFRIKAGLQQQDFAAKLGLAKASVCAWETGHTCPDIAHINTICDLLGITPSQLYGRQDVFTQEESNLINNIRQLSVIERKSIETLVDSLLEAKRLRQLRSPHLFKKKYAQATVAAGFGVNLDWGNDLEDIYLHDNPLIENTDLVFKVNGDSMEPNYPNGCLVSVAQLSRRDIHPGDTGIFQVDGNLFIKVFQSDGLHSYNEKYKPMLYRNYESIIAIGLVNGIIIDKYLASAKEIELFQACEHS